MVFDFYFDGVTVKTSNMPADNIIFMYTHDFVALWGGKKLDNFVTHSGPTTNVPKCNKGPKCNKSWS